MNKTTILPPSKIILKRVSENKLRIKYDLPIYCHIDEKYIFLGYHKIGITLREANNLKKHYILSQNNIKNKDYNLYECSRPFQKFYTKILGIYGLKNFDNIIMEKLPYYEKFEEKDSCFIIPNAIYLHGDGIKEIIRKWKIKNLLKQDSLPKNIDL